MQQSPTKQEEDSLSKQIKELKAKIGALENKLTKL
ncbi:hypothetical protein Runsl_0727 [Runella slithyformis DSM 19594]|uniref:Uncharacterized protein n=1 Tax=Runella slithyformis (strain ATCC 29530 / DSM 19594 / LMG 11500 / NCIMB 11436 / LSU 4) TaxID=761193 RepID=A0A7U3ZH88_RUNSL|nr:hypothetical protein Runsl_0727 [Runella slithyformis DSM 19594]